MSEPVKATRRHEYDELINPGDFKWNGVGELWIYFRCPCGCGDIFGVPVQGPKRWDFNGNMDAPTLTPSLLRLDGCGWHGYLTDGYFRQC